MSLKNLYSAYSTGMSVVGMIIFSPLILLFCFTTTRHSHEAVLRDIWTPNAGYSEEVILNFNHPNVVVTDSTNALENTPFEILSLNPDSNLKIKSNIFYIMPFHPGVVDGYDDYRIPENPNKRIWMYKSAIPEMSEAENQDPFYQTSAGKLPHYHWWDYGNSCEYIQGKSQPLFLAYVRFARMYSLIRADVTSASLGLKLDIANCEKVKPNVCYKYIKNTYGPSIAATWIDRYNYLFKDGSMPDIEFKLYWIKEYLSEYGQHVAHFDINSMENGPYIVAAIDKGDEPTTDISIGKAEEAFWNDYVFGNFTYQNSHQKMVMTKLRQADDLGFWLGSLDLPSINDDISQKIQADISIVNSELKYELGAAKKWYPEVMNSTGRSGMESGLGH